MALQDIISAITAEADRDIAALRKAHEERVSAAKAKHESALSSLKGTMSSQVASRKAQLLLKTKTHATMDRRNHISSAKQAVINAAFAESLALLAAQPDEKVEPLLRACLKRIKGAGTLHPSKRHEALIQKIAPSEQFMIATVTDAVGGFLFVGKSFEADFTFEHIVHGVLRPAKELEVADQLFQKHA